MRKKDGGNDFIMILGEKKGLKRSSLWAFSFLPMLVKSHISAGFGFAVIVHLP